MSEKRFNSIWDAIENTAQAAAAMRARAAAFAAVDRLRREIGITRRFHLRKIIEEGRR